MSCLAFAQLAYVSVRVAAQASAVLASEPFCCALWLAIADHPSTFVPKGEGGKTRDWRGGNERSDAGVPLGTARRSASDNKARRCGWSSEGVVTPREDSGRRPDKELSAICAGLFAFVYTAHEKGPAALSCLAFAQLAYVSVRVAAQAAALLLCLVISSRIGVTGGRVRLLRPREWMRQRTCPLCCAVLSCRKAKRASACHSAAFGNARSNMPVTYGLR